MGVAFGADMALEIIQETINNEDETQGS